VNTQADLALTDYDPPTHTELTEEINDVQTDISLLNNISTAQVNAEVLDVLNVDTFAEPGTGAPGATISLAAKINFLYKWARNRMTSTSSQVSYYNDDATTVGQKQTHSDDGSTYDRTEMTTGP
jgi:hypothetical protein